MQKVTVSLKNRSLTGNGKWAGWGTSLCWWANRVGYSEKMTEKAARLFFSEDGLHLNIMRYNIGGGDDPTHSHITRTDSMMPGFLEKDRETGELKWNYEADKRQLSILNACYKAAGKDAFIEAFSNSPPYFMTVSGCSSGHKRASCNNLREDCTTSFAEYLAHVCDHLQKRYGVKIGSLAPMNEPFTPYWYANSPKQEGCHVSPGKRQSTLLVETAKAMKKYSLNDTVLTASDETCTQSALISFKKLSPEALSSVGRISTHTYAKATAKIGNLCRKSGIDLWMTETDWSSISGENAGEMGAALWLSEKIIEDIYTLSPRAWVIWQIVAGYISKEGFMGRRDMPCMFNLNKGYWGCSVADIDSEDYILTQKYYAFGQFSRHIRPGMTVIRTDKASLAAYDEKTGRIVIVAVNPKKAEKEVVFDLSDFENLPEKARHIRTSGNGKDGEKWAEKEEIHLEDKLLRVKLIPNSVSTFILD